MRLDRALLKLRRFLTAPPTLSDQGRNVDLSTVLVLDGLPQQGQSVRDIALRLNVAHSTASRFVTRAEKSDMVRRSPSTEDGRKIVVIPTPTGRTLPARAAEYRLAYLRSVLTEWEADDIHALARSLSRFVADYESQSHLSDGSAT